MRRVLRDKFQYTDGAVFMAEALLRQISSVVEPQATLAVISADPDDDRVLEAAREGRADAIISGDRHLLGLGSFGGIVILTPRRFMDILRG